MSHLNRYRPGDDINTLQTWCQHLLLHPTNFLPSRGRHLENMSCVCDLFRHPWIAYEPEPVLPEKNIADIVLKSFIFTKWWIITHRLDYNEELLVIRWWRVNYTRGHVEVWCLYSMLSTCDGIRQMSWWEHPLFSARSEREDYEWRVFVSTTGPIPSNNHLHLPPQTLTLPWQMKQSKHVIGNIYCWQ